MHFGISEGKGGLKHGSHPWLGMDIFWNCPFSNFWPRGLESWIFVFWPTVSIKTIIKLFI